MNSKDSSILINGHQLREAMSFLAPDNTREQLDQEVIISTGAGECHSGPGLYCWAHEYPEEGAIKLDGTSRSAPPAAGVPEGYALVPLKPTIEMVEAGYEASLGQPDRSAHARVIEQYDAMLAEAPTPPASVQLTDAARDVLAERRRQVEDEQWTPEHDDRYRHRQLAMAAACYAAAVPVHDVLDCSDGRIEKRVPAVSRAWPWAKAWWKPGTARQNLVKAGALILAEIERLDRATATGLPEGRPSEAEESQP